MKAAYILSEYCKCKSQKTIFCKHSALYFEQKLTIAKKHCLSKEKTFLCSINVFAIIHINVQ